MILTPLYPQGNRPRYPLDSRLVGLTAGLFAVENCLAPSGNRTPAVQPVAIPAEHDLSTQCM
jgi:hypothetical protein